MGGLLEARQKKSTREFAPTADSDLKQLCTRSVPNQNETEPKCIPWNKFKTWQARDSCISKFAKVLIQGSFFRAQWFDYFLIPKPHSLSPSLATGLLSGWHAVPLAEQRKKIQDKDDPIHRTLCRGRVDALLRRRKRASTASTSPHPSE